MLRSAYASASQNKLNLHHPNNNGAKCMQNNRCECACARDSFGIMMPLQWQLFSERKVCPHAAASDLCIQKKSIRIRSGKSALRSCAIRVGSECVQTIARGAEKKRKRESLSPINGLHNVRVGLVCGSILYLLKSQSRKFVCCAQSKANAASTRWQFCICSGIISILYIIVCVYV